MGGVESEGKQVTEEEEEVPPEEKARRALLEQLSKVLHGSDMQVIQQDGPEYWKAWRDFYFLFRDWPDKMPRMRSMSDDEMRTFMEENRYLSWQDPRAQVLYAKYHELVGAKPVKD
jgi:hypothetical protein